MAKEASQREIGIIKEKVLLGVIKKRRLWRAMITRILKVYFTSKERNYMAVLCK